MDDSWSESGKVRELAVSIACSFWSELLTIAAELEDSHPVRPEAERIVASVIQILSERAEAIGAFRAKGVLERLVAREYKSSQEAPDNAVTESELARPEIPIAGLTA